MAVAVAAQTLLVAALAATAVRAARWLRRALLLRRIPGPRGALVGGQMAHFSQRSDHHKALQRWAAEFGGIYRIRLVDTTARRAPCFWPARRRTRLSQGRLPGQMIVLSDPHLVDIVLSRGNEVEKSVEAIYSRLDIVRTRRLQPCCCPRGGALFYNHAEAEHEVTS